VKIKKFLKKIKKIRLSSVFFITIFMMFSASSCVTPNSGEEPAITASDPVPTFADDADTTEEITEANEQSTFADEKPAVTSVNTETETKIEIETVTVDGRTDLISPPYRSDITEDIINIEFANNKGKTAKVYSQKQPDDVTITDTNGTKELITVVNMQNGKGSFKFPANEFPLGPISICVEVYGAENITDSAKPVDSAYFQFFNYAGVDWKSGIEKAPVNPVTEGMKITFVDNFNVMPVLTPTGLKMGKTGDLTGDLTAPRAYATRKVDNTGGTGGGMFGWSFFSDYIEKENDKRQKYNPFKIVSDGKGNTYMRLNTAYWPDAQNGVGDEISGQHYWGQKSTTGYLSSMGMDGSGFFTKGGNNQYFETRMFFGPNPAHWPAFWLLTANGGYLSKPDKNGNTPWGAPEWGGPSDELDILEAYLGNPEGYQIACHEWGYSTGKNGGTWVNLNQTIFQNINITEGFHILAALITEKITYYYCDNIFVFEHETLKYSWETGNYFIINGGVSDHFGLPKCDDDTFGPDSQPMGFTRYGNECYDYIDWVRVWEDEPGAPRFETVKSSVKAIPGDYVIIDIGRNEAARSLSGSYKINLPSNGWQIWEGDRFKAVSNASVSVSFTPGAMVDQILFMVPSSVEDGSKIEIEVNSGTPMSYTPKLAINLITSGEKGIEVVVSRDTFPLKGKKGETSGAWQNFDPKTYEESYFKFGGGWWNEAWSWMHNRSDSTGAVTFTFTGNAFELYHISWSSGADYSVEFDGEQVATVNTQSETDTVELGWSWADPSGKDQTHAVKIKCGAPKKHDWHVRLDSFKYWRHEDPSIAKYSITNAFFEVKKEGPVKPGDIIEIIVDRNMGTSSIYGAYHIAFPDYPEFGELGYRIIDADSGVHRYQDIIKIQLPSHINWTGKRDTISIDPPGSGHKTLSVTVQAP